MTALLDHGKNRAVAFLLVWVITAILFAQLVMHYSDTAGSLVSNITLSALPLGFILWAFADQFIIEQGRIRKCIMVVLPLVLQLGLVAMFILYHKYFR